MPNEYEKENAKKLYSQDIKRLSKTIIYEDKNILVLNKINGLPVQGGTKVNFNVDIALPYLTKEKDSLKLTHRIDKSTSGILILAKSREIAREMSFLFKQNKVSKTYWALTINSPKNKENIIKLPVSKILINRKEKMAVDIKSNKVAETSYRVLETKDNLSLLEVNPKTGRTHQIRVHLLHINTPIIGDKKYGLNQSNNLIDNFKKAKLHLHAKKVSFTLQNKTYNIEAKLPAYFKETLLKYNFEIKYE